MWLYGLLVLVLCLSGSHPSDDVDSGSGEPDITVTLDPERECQPVDLAFVMDSSGSINDDHPDNFDKMKDFLIDMVQMLPRMIGPGPMDNRIAVVTYSALTYTEFTFNDGTDPFVVEQLIEGIRYRGSETDITSGLERALNELFVTSSGDRPNAADVIVLITDGQGNRRSTEELQLAESIKTKNISIITVGITDEVNRDRLLEMASGGAFVMIDNFDVLETMSQTILDFACTPLEITTTTLAPTTTTEKPETTTEEIMTTTAAESLLCGDVNLVVLLDTSESLTEDLDHSKSSLLGILDRLEKDALNVKVFTFSENVHLEVDMTEENGPKLSDVLKNVKPSFGRTDLATSLDFVRRHGFNLTETKDATNVLLVITDGYSNMNSKNVLSMAEKIKNEQIHTVTVSVSEHVNSEVLQEISSSYMVHHSKNEDYQQAVVAELIAATCQKRAAPCERMDIVFVVDSSGSINEMDSSNFQLIKNYITDFAAMQELGPHATQIGMATFSSYGRYEFFLHEGRNISDVAGMVAGVRYISEMTNIAEGVKVARQQIFHGHGNRQNAQKLLVLITDGFTQGDTEDIEDEIHLVKQEGIYIVTVGFSSWSNREYLRYLSSDSNILQVPDYMALNQVVLDLTEASCSKDNSCPGHDIIFVVDSSWSMLSEGDNSWNHTLEFIKHVVLNIVIEPSSGSQVSVITFGTHGRVEFSLQEGTTEATIMELVNGIEHRGGKTNTAEGLELARKQLGSDAGREWANDVIVLLTNGPANEMMDDTGEEAMKAREEGAFIIGLGVTDDIDEEELRYISDIYYTAEEFTELQDLVNNVVYSICGAGTM